MVRTRLFFSSVAVGAAVACTGEDPPFLQHSSTQDAGREDAASGPDSAGADGGADTNVAPAADADAGHSNRPCDPTGPFGEPVEIAELHEPGTKELSIRLTNDGLQALVQRLDPAVAPNPRLYLTTRTSPKEKWARLTEAMRLPPHMNGAGVGTFDGSSTFYYEGPGRNTPTSPDLYVSGRSGLGTAFTTGSYIPRFSDYGAHATPYFVNGNLYYFHNSGTGQTGSVTIRVAKRKPNEVLEFEPSSALSNVSGDFRPVVTRDELTMFTNRDGKIRESHRAAPSADSPFGPSSIVGDGVISTGHESVSDISADQCTLYFSRTVGEEQKLFTTMRAP